MREKTVCLTTESREESDGNRREGYTAADSENAKGAAVQPHSNFM